MRVNYNEQHNDILEYFFAPYLLLSDPERSVVDNFTAKEREFFQKPLAILEEIQQAMSGLAADMEQYALYGNGMSLMQGLFMELLHQGQAFETIEQVHEAILDVSEERIEDVIRTVLATSADHRKHKEWSLWEILDQSDRTPEQKWYWSQALRRPKDFVQQAVDFSRKIVAVYQPFLERGRAERQAYVENFSLEELSQKASTFAIEDFLKNWDLDVFNLVVLSSWHFCFLFIGDEEKKESLGYFLVQSVGIEETLSGKQSLDVDDVTKALKTISDSTRYQVMVELTKPHVKSKNIAERLDITGAAVSFHTQKLVNSQLLLLSSQDKENKYEVNRDLLKQVIAKLEEDFDL